MNNYDYNLRLIFMNVYIKDFNLLNLCFGLKIFKDKYPWSILQGGLLKKIISE